MLGGLLGHGLLGRMLEQPDSTASGALGGLLHRMTQAREAIAAKMAP
jgi:hypothetical protein